MNYEDAGYKEMVRATEIALSEILGHNTESMTEDSRLFEDLHMDSTTGMELLMAMEERVGLIIDPEELDMDDFKTVGTFAAYAMRQCAPGNGNS
jgi:acyl carrier protein